MYRTWLFKALNSVKTVTPVRTVSFELRVPSLGHLLLRLVLDRDAFRSLWFAVVAENAVGWEGLRTAKVKGGLPNGKMLMS